jgi:hypothetical protein
VETRDAPSGVGPPEPWVSNGDTRALQRRATDWLRSDGLRSVLQAFGEADLAADINDGATLARLRAWSKSHLDSRAGRERHEVQLVDYTPEQVRLLQAAADSLGLVRTAAPVHQAYDLTIVVGGTVTGNVIRTRYAVEQQSKGVDLGKLVGAGGYRPLTSTEGAAALGSDAPLAARSDEYGHLAWVLGTHMSATGRSVVRSDGEADSFSSSRIEALDRAGVPVAFVVQAPSRRPGRRADTLDAVLFARAELGSAAARTLVITSSIYAPYTFFLLAPHATPQSQIEIVGTPTARSDKPAVQAQRFAQEINSTLSVLPI